MLLNFSGYNFVIRRKILLRENPIFMEWGDDVDYINNKYYEKLKRREELKC